MKNHCFKHFLLGLASFFIMDAATPAFSFYYASPTISKSGNFLANEEPIGDAELDNMRGGFITGSGIVIDFAFSANTLIDGKLINQMVLNTADIATNARSLRNIIQVGEGNSAFNSAADISALPNVLTVVQNNLDNLTIQQVNLLDLTIQNMSNYTKQAFIPEIDFQNTIRIVP